MPTALAKILVRCFLPLGILASAAALRAQDLAPASLNGTIYAALQDIPRDTFTLPAHSGVLGVNGRRYPINVSFQQTFSGSDPFSWAKTSPNSGAFTIRLGVRTARLDITFTTATQGTYRQQTDETAEIATGVIFFSAIPPDPLPPLVNLSTRTSLTAAQPVTVGFVVEGPAPRRVLVRAIGPTLAQFGVTNPVANPALTVFRGNTQIAANSGWGGTANLAAVFSAVGAFALPATSRDSAVVLTLEPGNYTAHARADTAGEILLEVYFVD